MCENVYEENFGLLGLNSQSWNTEVHWIQAQNCLSISCKPLTWRKKTAYTTNAPFHSHPIIHHRTFTMSSPSGFRVGYRTEHHASLCRQPRRASNPLFTFQHRATAATWTAIQDFLYRTFDSQFQKWHCVFTNSINFYLDSHFRSVFMDDVLQ